MTKLVPDIRQIRIETWKANHRLMLAMGVVFIAAGLYRFEADGWALSWLVAIYLLIGPTLLAGGLWLIARGPLLEIEDGKLSEHAHDDGDEMKQKNATSPRHPGSN